MAARDETLSIQEIAALTARLRQLSASGRDADPAERATFLADKDALLARIENTAHTVGEDRDADGWFAEGYDAAHSAYLDELGRVDALDALADVDGRRLPPWPAGTMPPEMLDGIEDRRNAPAQADDPAEIQARADALRRQIRERSMPHRNAEDARAAETGEWARGQDSDAEDDGWSR